MAEVNEDALTAQILRELLSQQRNNQTLTRGSLEYLARRASQRIISSRSESIHSAVVSFPEIVDLLEQERPDRLYANQPLHLRLLLKMVESERKICGIFPFC